MTPRLVAVSAREGDLPDDALGRARLCGSAGRARVVERPLRVRFRGVEIALREIGTGEIPEDVGVVRRAANGVEPRLRVAQVRLADVHVARLDPRRSEADERDRDA